MVIFVTVVAIGLFAFWFFGRPAVRIENPSHEIETRSGRTTVHQYRAKSPKALGQVVLVHGFCENHLYFRRLAGLFNEAGYDCLAVNLFGYAGSLSDSETGYSVQAYAQQLREALSELERLRLLKTLIAVYGHSMGGTVVYLAGDEILARHPEVKALVLENPGFKHTFTFLARTLKPFAKLANFTGPRRVLQLFVDLLFGIGIKERSGKQFIRHLLTWYAPRKEVAVQNLSSIFEVTFSAEETAGIADRLHLVISRRDKLNSFRKVQEKVLAAVSEDASSRERLLILAHADHFASLQVPDEIVAFLLQRIKEEAGSPAAVAE